MTHVTTGPLPSGLLQRVQREGRRLGLPLDDLELLTQDPKVARAFLRALRQGRGQTFVHNLDRTALERRLQDHERGIRSPAAPGLLALG